MIRTRQSGKGKLVDGLKPTTLSKSIIREKR